MSSKLLATALMLTLWSFVGIQPASADVMQEFSPEMNIADGKAGTVFRKWTQPVNNKAVYEVRAKVYRKTGGDDCYINLRFGDGKAFEGGKRIHVKEGKQTVSWKVGNELPNGRPLVMNAYNGTVYLRYVTVRNDR